MRKIFWQEPLSAKRARSPGFGVWCRGRLKFSIAWGAAAGGIDLLYCAAAQLFGLPTPKNPFLFLVLVSSAAAIFQGYIKPGIVSLIEPSIVISSVGINRNQYNVLLPMLKIEFWPWTRIASLSVESHVIEGAIITFLVLADHQLNRIASIGVGSDVSLAAIGETAKNHGVRTEGF